MATNYVIRDRRPKPQTCKCCAGTHFLKPQGKKKQIAVYRGVQYRSDLHLIAAFKGEFGVTSKAGLRARWRAGQCFRLTQSEIQSMRMAPNGLLSLKQPKSTAMISRWLLAKFPGPRQRVIDGRSYHVHI